ncbi:MAG: UvrB/UvrC motif-containing protein [Planctomycetota bacterium]|nr:UvrB/UvrC motif-containing protein [Planctomycetota bacterium]MDA1211665.1 UvrB/UvrC motif-containing protein [Planctomycetota bacterium]
MKKCRRCSKPATLHITEIVNSEVQTLHLCEGCAQSYLSQQDQPDPDEMSPAAAKLIEGADLDELDHIVCPNCGISFREFRSQGRLGCPHDYIAFEAELMPLLENIHGATQHCGKCPKRAPDSSQRQYELIKLRNELRSLVEGEKYEDAARLRDQIQSLEVELAEDQPEANDKDDD